MNLEKQIIYLIRDNDDLVEYKKNQIIILESMLKDGIYELIEDAQEKIVDTKEFIRIAIRKSLKLKVSDIIVIKQDHIFIKIFNEKKRNKVSSSEVKTIASRFNGINKDELDDFYDEYFSKEEVKSFFDLIVSQFVQTYFIEEKIDNNLYENNVFGYIHELIINQLLSEFDHSKEFLKGFSGYVFRIHFNDVFESISEFVLNEISISNEYMIDFLKYYSLNIVILNGEKYKVPSLETDKGLKWNVISMLSIVKVYTRTKTSIQKLQKELHILDNQILKLFINDLSPVEFNNLYKKEKKKLSDKIVKESRSLAELIDSSQRSENKNIKDKIKKNIEKIKQNIILMKKSLEKLSAKEISRKNIDKYIKLEREMENGLRELKAQEKILIQNKDSYLSIKKSLVKALISKKQRI
nr:hypothetical protein [uncultured Sulfurimonas sp.]